MIPHELILQNFMCYRDGLDPLRLDGLHVVCLSGENGAGKSALLDAITWALWGKARMPDDDLIAQGESEMLVDLSFDLNGHLYRVTRRRQRSRTGPRGGQVAGKSWLEFQVQNGADWRSLSANRLADTEREIEQLLRMKYDTFINASFLLQGRADEFTRKTAGERKQVLADILDLGEYAQLEERARKRFKRLDDELKALGGRIEQLEQQAGQFEHWQQEVAAATARCTELSTAVATDEAAWQQAAETLRRLEDQAARRKELARRLDDLRQARRQAEHELADLRERIGAADALIGRQAAIEQGIIQLRAAHTERSRLDGLRPRYEALREQWRELADQIKDERRRLESERDAAAGEYARLSEQLERRPPLLEHRQALQQQLAELEPLATGLQELRQQIAVLDERISRAASVLLQRSELQAIIEKRQDSLVAVREEQKRTIGRLEKQLADLPRWQAELEQARRSRGFAEQARPQLAELRDRAQAGRERSGELRALCDQYKQRADQIKLDRERLAATESSSCPLCRSDLGSGGREHVLAHYDADIDTLRRQYRESQREARDLEQQVQVWQNECTDLETRLRDADTLLAQIDLREQQVAQAGEQQVELQAARTTLADVEQQLAEERFAAEERAGLAALEAELTELGVQLAAKHKGKSKSTPTRSLEQERDALRRQSSSIEQQLEARPRIERELATLDHELAGLESITATLPTVAVRRQELDTLLEREDYATELRRTQSQVQTAATELGYSAEAYQAVLNEIRSLEHWEQEERDLQAARLRRESDEQLLHKADELQQRRNADIEALLRDDAQLEQELRELPAARATADEREKQLAARRNNLRVAERDLAEKETLLNKTREAVEQLAAACKQRQSLQERRDLFRELSEAFGKKGVQAMLIETAIPQVEDEANRLLARMTDNQMHVTFEMQRDTRKGDTVETLEIKIADGLGTRIYDAFSGGEAMRVNFAVRIALSRLLAHRSGASLETLVIDEGFGTLDAAGRERFVEAITSVQEDFRRILVITHIDELKERFPALIEVVKTGSGSRWELR
jgi:exonuclease SbcC